MYRSAMHGTACLLDPGQLEAAAGGVLGPGPPLPRLLVDCARIR